MSERHPLVRLEALVLIAIGGFAGSNLRYFIDLLAPGLQGTLAVNTLGCFALGFLVYEMQYSGILTEQTRITAGTGFLSSFTTYSTFALESILSGSGIVLIGYVAITYALGFGGVVAGRTLARRVDDGVSNG
jgi:CrcB protein